MKRMTISWLALVLGMSLVLPAQAQHERYQHDRGGDQLSGESNPEMMETIHRMMADPEHRSMMLVCLSSELSEELGLSALQMERLEALRTEIMGGEDMHTAMAEAASTARSVLTEEQRAAFDEMDDGRMHEAMMARMHAASEGHEECPMMKGMMDKHGGAHGHHHH